VIAGQNEPDGNENVSPGPQLGRHPVDFGRAGAFSTQFLLRRLPEQ
jgi:hypothetical protein